MARLGIRFDLPIPRVFKVNVAQAVKKFALLGFRQPFHGGDDFSDCAHSEKLVESNDDSNAGRDALMPNHFHRVVETPPDATGEPGGWHEVVPRHFHGTPQSTHLGSERAETDVEKAEGIIAAELQRCGWSAEPLRERPKGDAIKVKLAVRLRTETVRTVAWLAQRLHLGSRAYAHHRLWRARRNASRP